MKKRQNCWEYKKCGREPGGNQTEELGVCPSTTDTTSNGLNGGRNAGRICWAVAGTFCGNKVQGKFAEKEFTCMNCDFYKKVKEEQGTVKFMLLKPGQVYKPNDQSADQCNYCLFYPVSFNFQIPSDQF